MPRTKEDILSPLPKSSLEYARLEISIDIRDQLRRIANALENNNRLPNVTSGQPHTRASPWAHKEKIACPLCFKKHKNIKLHVLRKHNMTLDEAHKITTK